MAIEFNKQITFNENTTIYGHNGYDEGGFPSNAGHGNIKQILDLSQKDVLTYLKQNISVEVDTTNKLKYNLILDGQIIASFEVPPDKFLESASYDADTNKLILVFNTGIETSTVEIDMSDLIDTYTAGLGLQLTGSEFSIKLKSSEARLKVDESGMYLDLSDIEELKDTKLNVDGTNGTASGTSALLNKLTVDSSTPNDNDYFILQLNSGISNRLSLTKLYDYILSKLDIANYYPTAFTWHNGTSEGPTGTLSGEGMEAVDFGAIPSASVSTSGVVTTGAQTIAGAKTFNDKMTVNNDVAIKGSLLSYDQTYGVLTIRT